MTLHDNMWKKLQSESVTGERITAKLAMPEISRRLYIGIDSNKKRHLLIPLEENEEEYSDLQSKGLSITTKELVIGGKSKKRYIDVICQDISGHTIFDAIANEIAVGLDKGIPKEVIALVIGKWRNFWDKPIQDTLSRNSIIGLFAELWFLYGWLLPNQNKLEAINRWRGPFSSRHDFEWNKKSIEVKATTNAQSRIHKINGIEQLSPPNNGELFLFSLRIREEQTSDHTLPSIIGMCREKLKEDVEALSKFENILAITGYSPFYDAEYSKIKFRVVDEKLYRVADEFPRLIVDSFIEGIPSGVGMVEYTINLDGYGSLCIANSPEEAKNILD